MVDGILSFHRASERDEVGVERGKGLFLRRLQLAVTQYKRSLTRARKMKEGKVCKILLSGDARDGERRMEEKESRGQRLVTRANPGDSRVACQWKCIMGIILWLCVLAWKERDHL